MPRFLSLPSLVLLTSYIYPIIHKTENFKYIRPVIDVASESHAILKGGWRIYSRKAFIKHRRRILCKNSSKRFEDKIRAAGYQQRPLDGVALDDEICDEIEEHRKLLSFSVEKRQREHF